MTNTATPLHRFLAFLIDTVIGFTFGALMVYYLSFAATPTLLLNSLLSILILFIFFGFSYTFITSYLISVFGGSIGKLLTGISVIDSKNTHLTFWLAFFRQTVGYTVSGSLFGLGFIWILVDKGRRAWHDLVSGTYVVKTHSTGLLTGLLALLAIVLLNVWLVRQSYSNFSRHKFIYRDMFQDLTSEPQIQYPEGPYDETI